MDRVIAVGEDQYWLAAVKKIEAPWLSVETISCDRPLLDCFGCLPAPDKESLLLVDACSKVDLSEIVSELARLGWGYIVVVAADPSARESSRVLQESGVVDYWDKTYQIADIRASVEKCLQDMQSHKSRTRPLKKPATPGKG